MAWEQTKVFSEPHPGLSDSRRKFTSLNAQERSIAHTVHCNKGRYMNGIPCSVGKARKVSATQT